MFKALFDCGERSILLSTRELFADQFRDKVKPVHLPKPLTHLQNSKCDEMSESELVQYCKEKMDTLNINEEQASKIERETREQHRSSHWHAMRAGRVTASQMHSVNRFNFDKPATSTIKSVCYPKTMKPTEATSWGISNEDRARRDYLLASKQSHDKVNVEKSGFIINPNIPYVGASPDGIVTCNCCEKGVLEIKCPFKHKDKTIIEACRNDKDFCLKEENGELILDKKHPQ